VNDLRLTANVNNNGSPADIKRSSLEDWRGVLEGGVMAKKRKPQFKMPEKTCWHLYSLQDLQTDKFIKVVGKILSKEYSLIK